MTKRELYVDFHNADPKGRVRLNCVGTLEGLERERITLSEGLALLVHDDELETEGIVRYSKGENLWVAEIDWDAIRPRQGAPFNAAT
jgi:hypothetical protein